MAKLCRRAEGNFSGAHSELSSSDVPGCKQFKKGLEKWKKKKFLQDTLSFDAVQDRGLPKISAVKQSGESLPDVQKVKGGTVMKR